MAEVTIRTAEPSDQAECGRILYAAFHDIATRHGFPPDFPSPQYAEGLMRHLVANTFGVVAERDGRILGSNFLREGDPIRPVGPISVDPELQESGVGRQLMQAVIDRGRDAEGIRLVQDAFNMTSMALYASMGFEVREPLALFSGRPSTSAPAGIDVRPMEEADVDECAALCQKVHGITRTDEVRRSRALGSFVAERDGRITAYATTLEFWFAAHGVAETDDDFRALLAGAAAAREGQLSFLLPTRQAELFRFCLSAGLRMLKPMTLMSMGPYQEPAARFFPSVGY